MIELTRHTEYGYSFSKQYHPKWRRVGYWDLPQEIRSQQSSLLDSGFLQYRVLFFDGVNCVYPVKDDAELWDRIVKKGEEFLAIAQLNGHQEITADICQSIAINQLTLIDIKLDQMNGLMTLENAVKQAIAQIGYSIEDVSLPPYPLDLSIGETRDIESYVHQSIQLSLWDSEYSVVK